MYFCFWNIFSKALRCTSENTALLSIPLRGFPLAARGHEKVPGMGTTDEDAEKDRRNWKLLVFLHHLHLRDKLCLGKKANNDNTTKKINSYHFNNDTGLLKKQNTQKSEAFCEYNDSYFKPNLFSFFS